MKLLNFDLGMGAAGDMIMASLISLIPEEEQKNFIEKINSIGIPAVTVELLDDVKCGITGKHVKVLVGNVEESSNDIYEHVHHHNHEDGHDHHHDHDHEHHHDHDHDHHDHNHDHEADHEHTHTHDHEHDHHHDHEHNHEHDHEHTHTHDHVHESYHDILHLISHLNVSDKVKEDAKNIYKLVAEAESLVHGKPVNQVHFHEVGAMDAVCDIVGTAMLMEIISPDKVISTPVNTGYGKVKCAHGIMPVPAPATAEILKGIPVYAGHFEGEMCTPTGAAIIKYYSEEFREMPIMKIEKVGYGTGNKDFPAANVVKTVLGEADSSDSDRVIELRANIDDMTGEDISLAVDILMDNGARDAFVTPIIMKKGRPGFLLTVLCTAKDKTEIAELIFKHTSTIGIRECVMERMILNREIKTVETKYGNIDVKVSEGFGVKKAKPEFEDMKKIAVEKNISIAVIRKEVDRQVK